MGAIVNTPPEYPQRAPYWAHVFCRLLTKSAAAQELGPECCWLLAVIVHQEDATRYKRAVTFWNDQLLPLCGFGSSKRLVAARDKAIKAGFLHYEPGGKGKTGRYWVTVPPDLESVADSPVSESGLRDETERQNGLRDETERNSKRQPHDNGTTKGNHSTLSLIPNPVKREPLPELVSLIEFWNREIAKHFDLPTCQLPPAKKLQTLYRSALADPEKRAALSDHAKIAQAIRDSEFVRGNPCFSLPGLLTNNKLGDSKLIKLVNGDYRNGKSSRRQSSNDRAGDATNYSGTF